MAKKSAADNEKEKEPVVESKEETTALAPKRGRGRPKGTTGTKRPDRTANLEPGDNRKYLQHDMKLFQLEKVDMRDTAAVEQRVAEYFYLCEEDDMKPSVAGMALAFGVERKTLWAWVNEVDSAYVPQESRNAIKKAYQILNAQMENYMQNGKINPVAGIFLMKNNMGYQDKQEMVLTPNTQNEGQPSPEELQQKYIVDTSYKYVDGDE